MTHRIVLPLLAAAALLVAASAGAAERAKAKVDCKEAGEKHVYDCTIMLTGKKSGKPMDGAKITIGADMPSMAMAHNIRPVTAEPMGKPGMYHARIKLDMLGEWALKMDISGPTRDRIIHVMRFGRGMDMKHGMGMKGDMKDGSGGMKDMKHGADGMKDMKKAE